MNFSFKLTSFPLLLLLIISNLPLYAQNNGDNNNLENKLIAHRGLWTSGHPQNSQAAIEAALNSGLKGFECDIQQSADGILFLNHDNEIGDLVIASTDFNLLKEKNPDIPLLSDILILKQSYPEKVMYAEVKSGNPEDIIDEFTKYGLTENIIFKSFNKDICLGLISLTEQPVYLLSANSNLDYDALKKEGFSGVSLMYEKDKTSPQLIEKIHNAGLKTAFWTINDESLANQLSSWGTDHIVSDITF